MSHGQRKRLLTGVLVGLLALPACGPPHPLAERRLKHREDNLRWSVHVLTYRDRIAEQRLKEAGDYIASDIAQDARDTEENARGFVEFFRRDFERFEARQKDYLRAIERIFGGDLSDWEENAIRLFL